MSSQSWQGILTKALTTSTPLHIPKECWTYKFKRSSPKAVKLAFTTISRTGIHQMKIITLTLILLLQGRWIRTAAENQDQDIMEYLGGITEEIQSLNEKYESLNAKSELSLNKMVDMLVASKLRQKNNQDVKEDIKSIKWDVKSMMETSENKTQIHEKKLEEILERLNGIELPNKTQALCNADISLKKVNFSSIEGEAGATSFYGDCCTPYKGFDGPEWHSGESTMPQALWFHLEQPIKVVMYYFMSRPEDGGHLTDDGPSKYEFFGSNGTDCSDQSSWVVLKRDDSGTPFTPEYKYRIEYVPHPDFYTCYGFKIKEVPGRSNGNKWAVITNIKWFISYFPEIM